MFSPNCTVMDDIFSGSSSDNFKETRGRTLSSKSQVSRNLLISSTTSLVAYYTKMKCNNTMIEDINMDNDSSDLSYKTTQEKAIWVSKVVNNNNNMFPISPPTHQLLILMMQSSMLHYCTILIL